ncbi:MAG: hypothetical protein P9L98_02760 [Candidatus Kaelpia imicola]|nr:hypothetical protein [Candidatus Kaelpia imicola]
MRILVVLLVFFILSGSIFILNQRENYNIVELTDYTLSYDLLSEENLKP